MQWRPSRAVDVALAAEGRVERPEVTSCLWYRAPLSAASFGAHHVPIIGQHFVEALGAADWPDGACLFLCDDALYFSPAAIAAVPYLIVACGAEPSPPPERASATLLAGRTSDWRLLPHERH